MIKNINWYKIAQGEDWYNVETAEITKDPEILAKILRKGNDDRISWNAIQNPNCPSEILVEILKRGKDDWISRFAAKNPNCPPEALAEVLRRGKDLVVSSCAAINPNCPSEALAEVLRRGNDDNVSYRAAFHPNCPPEALAEVLRRGNDDCVSGAATRNPNALPKDILEWYEATGKLTKYDPEKHELEKVEEDKDLEELRKLMGKNRSLHKKSQKEDWYNDVILIKDPNILEEILMKGKNDSISQDAARNPNCPPEALAEVLRRGKNDLVSCYAAQHPNCPFEALEEVVRRGKNDWVSRFAALNPNFPPKERMEWFESTGQLTKYDPEKHELEKVEEDKDLEELRKLMGKNNNDFPIIVISAKDVDISKINRAYDYFKNVFDDTKVQDSNSHLQHIIESNKFNRKELRKFMLMVKKLLHENSVTLDFVEKF